MTFVVAACPTSLVEMPIRRQGLSGLAARLRRMGVGGVRPGRHRHGPRRHRRRRGRGDDRRRRHRRRRHRLVPGHRAGDGSAGHDVGGGCPAAPLPAVPADRPLRVMVGGDSQAWSLGSRGSTTNGRTPEGLEVRMVADLGCRITPGTPVVDGFEHEDPFCQDWREVWEATAFGLQPDVMVDHVGRLGGVRPSPRRQGSCAGQRRVRRAVPAALVDSIECCGRGGARHPPGLRHGAVHGRGQPVPRGRRQPAQRPGQAPMGERADRRGRRPATRVGP